MVLVCVTAGITSALAMEERDDRSEQYGYRDVVRGMQAGADIPVRYTNSPTPVPTLLLEEASGPTPEPATPEPEPIAAVPGTDVERVICALPWDCGSAIAVAFCESTLQPWADNGISYGLFALWGGHVKRWPDFWSWWSDPVANAAHAYELYAEQGWVPWLPSSSCSGVY